MTTTMLTTRLRIHFFSRSAATEFVACWSNYELMTKTDLSNVLFSTNEHYFDRSRSVLTSVAHTGYNSYHNFSLVVCRLTMMWRLHHIVSHIITVLRWPGML